MEKLQLYRPTFVEFEGKVIRRIERTKIVDSPAVFFSYEAAENFNSWWTWKRKSDGKLSVRPIAATREQLLYSTGLTGIPPNLKIIDVPVEFINQSLVESKPKERFYSGFSWYRADWEDNFKLAIQVARSSNAEAAIALLGLMQHLSREYYQASWASGLGYTLFDALNGLLEYITLEEIKLLTSFSSACGGWWDWSDSKDELCFWGIEEWKQQKKL